jgi:hypothetical protein
MEVANRTAFHDTPNLSLPDLCFTLQECSKFAFHALPIIGMDSLNNLRVSGRLVARGAAVDSNEFVGPPQRVVLQIEIPTSDLGDLLRFPQALLTVPQGFVRFPPNFIVFTEFLEHSTRFTAEFTDLIASIGCNRDREVLGVPDFHEAAREFPERREDYTMHGDDHEEGEKPSLYEQP